MIVNKYIYKINAFIDYPGLGKDEKYSKNFIFDYWKVCLKRR